VIPFPEGDEGRAKVAQAAQFLVVIVGFRGGGGLAHGDGEARREYQCQLIRETAGVGFQRKLGSLGAEPAEGFQRILAGLPAPISAWPISKQHCPPGNGCNY